MLNDGEAEPRVEVDGRAQAQGVVRPVLRPLGFWLLLYNY